MKLGIILFRVESWFDENLLPVIDMIQHADRKGIDVVNISEHIVMGTRDLLACPYAEGVDQRAKVFDENTNFWEPVVLLSWIGSRTKRIRLSTHVLLAGLRPAILIAKQLATLDVLTEGRVEAIVGVGWQKIEYDAEGLAWDGRFGRMIETVEACKRLWTQAPASFEGKHVSFEGIYCRPFPVQEGGPPIMFGLGPSERNIERIARFADGWAPLQLPLPLVEETTKRIKDRMEVLGRDSSKFRLVLIPDTVYSSNKPDVKATLAGLPKLTQAGCTDVNIRIIEFCSGPDDYDSVLEEYLTYSDGRS